MIYIYIYSLCERVLDVWLIKQGVTGFFIIFNTNTTLIFVLPSVRHSPVFCMSVVYLSITKLFDKINNSIYTTVTRDASSMRHRSSDYRAAKTEREREREYK